MLLSPLAETVLKTRYLDPDETPDDMFKRVALHVPTKARGTAYGEQMFPRYYELISSLRFLPNSPTLANAGRSLGQLSACFVLPIEDSLSSIFETAKNMAIVHKSGGGTGFSFGNLRPKGAAVRGIPGVAGGPVSFMKLFNAVSLAVEQGSMRHGANMAILPVDHPDIREFIHCKDENPEALSAFNISVGVTAHWMEKATKPLSSGVEPTEEQALLREIAESAWKTGDPGLVFLDRINAGRANPVPSLGPIEATNPCGEQPLYAFDSCNLGSLNLAKYWRGGKSWDAQQMQEDIHLAVRFLDDVIDANEYPLPQIQNVTTAVRRIGLGVMGLADLLAYCKIPYDSEEALDFCNDLATFIQETAHRASSALALERGAFPAGDPFQTERNATVTTIAPTGTISIIAGCSSGIEPHFALEFERNHADDIGGGYKERIAPYEAWRSAVTREDADLLDPPPWFRVAHQIDPVWHLRMQAVWQNHVDNAVSKTINLRHESTPQDIFKAYSLAYDFGLLGVTVYRDGCRETQVLSTPSSETPSPTSSPSEGPARIKPPKNRASLTHSFRIGDSKGYIHVGFYPGGLKIAEVFAKMDKAGSLTSNMLDAVCMSISVGVQHGVPLSIFTEKYKHTRFEPSGLTDNPKIPTTSSPLDYLSRFLETCQSLVFDFEKPDIPIPLRTYSEPCPKCGGRVVFEEGCSHCSSCDYSRC